jgi:hypothetical protein
VAGAAAGARFTGLTAGVATTVGTGLVVGTGTAAVRGTSAAVGHGFAGSSLEQISEVFINESIQGFREGFVAGAAGGAARVLGPALGVGAQVSGQVARRVAAGAIVDGTTAMVETLMRGGSVAEAVSVGVRSAALSVPGSLVGVSSNRLVRELGGPLTAGATAYAGAIASGASPQEAMRSAGLAVTSNLVMSRASHGSAEDAALEARGRALGERARARVSAGTNSGSQVRVVTRLQDVDVSPASLSSQQRVEYEQQFVQYHRNAQASFDAGRRQTPPMTRENYIRFRHGVATGQVIPNASSHVGALIDDALAGAVSPEQAFGFTQSQTEAAGVVLGRPMTSSEIGELGHIWQNAENAGEVATLTRENSRRLFDNHRNRFWRAVRGSDSARAHFESMGFTFPASPTTAPVRVLPDGRTVTATIDHITERQTAPNRALDANNLRFSFGRENTVVLRLLNDLDPFLREPQVALADVANAID